jgi:cytochrome c oxidase subunit IV
MSERVASSGGYVVAAIVLLVMTGANIGLATIDLHGLNSAVGLLIAASEVVIMAVYFMHLRWSAPITRLVGLAALLWLSILMAGTLDDLLTRGWLPIPGK